MALVNASVMNKRANPPTNPATAASPPSSRASGKRSTNASASSIPAAKAAAEERPLAPNSPPSRARRLRRRKAHCGQRSHQDRVHGSHLPPTVAPINPTLSPSTCSRSTSRKPPGCAHGDLYDSREIHARQSCLIGRLGSTVKFCQIFVNSLELVAFGNHKRLALLARFRSILSGREWAYLSGLLVLSWSYNLVLKGIRIDSQEELSGGFAASTLGCARSPAFQPGVRVLWVEAIRPNAAKSSPLACGSSLPCGHGYSSSRRRPRPLGYFQGDPARR